MRTANPVLLLHDAGELDDVAALLRGLGIPFSERHGAEADAPLVLPRDLVVATARRAVKLPPPPAGRHEGRGPARVVVVGSDAQNLRGGLRDAGFELLVRRPVHPTALRLLLLRLLYRGPERRRQSRVAVGATCRYRPTFLWRSAILTELSSGGCRLLTPRSLRTGRRILVEIPDLTAAGTSLRVPGRVARANALGPTDPTFTLAVEFVTLDDATRAKVEGMVAEHARGPASLPGGWNLEEPAPTTGLPAVAAGMDAEPTALETTPRGASETDAGDGGADRRRHRRAPYGARVVTLGEEAAHVVMGRDLSLGGLRIEPHGALERGQRVTLALHGAALAVPLVVQGTVFRDDGTAGLVIRFDESTDAQREGLEKLLAELGGIETLGADAEGTTSIVARILSPAEANALG